MLSRCPRCDSWMRPRYNFGVSSCVCTSCGYVPKSVTTNRVDPEEFPSETLNSSSTLSKEEYLESVY